MDISQKLLDCNDLRTKEVEVPQWDTTLTIQELGLQESMIGFGSVKPDADGEITLDYFDIARIVAFGVVDESGDRVFSDEQIPELARKNQKVLMKLYVEITNLSGSVEDEEKN